MSSFNRANSHTRTSHCQHRHKVKKQKEKHASCRRQFLPCNRLFNQGGGMGLRILEKHAKDAALYGVIVNFIREGECV